MTGREKREAWKGEETQNTEQKPTVYTLESHIGKDCFEKSRPGTCEVRQRGGQFRTRHPSAFTQAVASSDYHQVPVA